MTDNTTEVLHATTTDMVNHPPHYTSHPSGVECIELTRFMDFSLGNAFKYLHRDGLKGVDVPMEDIAKALWYVEDYLASRGSVPDMNQVRKYLHQSPPIMSALWYGSQAYDAGAIRKVRDMLRARLNYAPH